MSILKFLKLPFLRTEPTSPAQAGENQVKKNTSGHLSYGQILAFEKLAKQNLLKEQEKSKQKQ